MSNRHAVRARKVPVSVTLSPEDYEFLEMLINSRRFHHRTHAISYAIMLLRTEWNRQQQYLTNTPSQPRPGPAPTNQNSGQPPHSSQ